MLEEPSPKSRAIAKGAPRAHNAHETHTSRLIATLPPKLRGATLRISRSAANMLNPKARQLLRCTALARSGSRCRAYIVGGLEVCISHSPWRSRGPGSKRLPIRRSRVACRCEAYTWPHRRGSGVCRWPDPPETPCTIPTGTRRSTRLRSIQQAQMLELHQLSKHAKTTLPERQDPIEPTVVCLSRIVRAPRYF